MTMHAVPPHRLHFVEEEARSLSISIQSTVISAGQQMSSMPAAIVLDDNCRVLGLGSRLLVRTSDPPSRCQSIIIITRSLLGCLGDVS